MESCCKKVRYKLVIESPCINVCTVVDGECVGCFRTEKQIEEWLHYTDEERRKIIEECETKMYQTQ